MRARDHISAKIDLLFRTVIRGDGREFTYDDVEQGTDGRVSRSYVWKLRHGKNTNPSLDVLEALATFFRVPPEFFFSGSQEHETRSLRLASASAVMEDPAARMVAERARGLSAASLEAVGRLLENLHAIERSKTWIAQSGAAASRGGVPSVASTTPGGAEG